MSHGFDRTYLAGHELSLADVAVYVELSQIRYTPPTVSELPWVKIQIQNEYVYCCIGY